MKNKQQLDDTYIDPDVLKAEEKEADGFWEAREPEQQAEKAVERPRPPIGRKLALIAATFVIALSMGIWLGARQQTGEPTIVPDVPDTHTTLIDDSADMTDFGDAPINEAAAFPVALDTTQVEIPEGTVTEWLAGIPENDEIPWFRDMAWHAGTGRVYLVASSDQLYIIDPVTQMIDVRDLGLRLGSSSIYLDLVASYDDERLVLFNDNSDNEVIVYNVVRDRVEQTFGGRDETGAPGTLYLVSEQGLAVGVDKTIYLHHTITSDDGDDGYVDQIEVFSPTGAYVRSIPVERGSDVVSVGPDGLLYTTGYGAINQYDPAGHLAASQERDTFRHVRDLQFDMSGNYYVTHGFEFWFAQVQSDGQLGEIYGPAVDLMADYWPLGQFRRPEALIVLPEANTFLLLDGDYAFQRIVKLELNKEIMGTGR